MLHDTTTAGEAAAFRGSWLILLYQVPGRSSSVRVRVWRRLQSFGAVQVRQSAYVLPNRDQAREDLEWLKAEIVGLGGEATVFSADTLEPSAHEEIVEAFRTARGGDVAGLIKRGTRWLRQAAKHDGERAALPAPLARTARSLVEDWRALTAITYFDVPGFGEMEGIVQQISQHVSGRPRPAAPSGSSATAVTGFTRRRWVTRPRPGVDRMASAWLIRRFVDPHARFEFADHPATEAEAFDMYEGAFGHQGDKCTYEVLAERFGLDDPAVRWIGAMVHDLDLRETRFNEPETAGLGLMVEGLRRAHPDDPTLLEHGIGLFESLALAFPGRSAAPASATAPESRTSMRSPGRRRRSR